MDDRGSAIDTTRRQPVPPVTWCTFQADPAASGTRRTTATQHRRAAPAGCDDRPQPDRLTMRRPSAPWIRATAYWSTSYRRTWRGSIFSSFLSPVLFLAAMGKGLGTLVDANSSLDARTGVGYLAFLAPGLLYDRAAELALEAGAVAVAQPFGADPDVAHVVLARYLVGAVELVPV